MDDAWVRANSERQRGLKLGNDAPIKYDGFFFYRLGPLGEEEAGRHIDDFLLTGPEQERYKLNMPDAVRLYGTGDQGRLLAMNFRKLETLYSLQGNPLLVQGKLP